MTTEGIDVRSVGNTLTLHETALVEAFNLKAAIEYQLKNCKCVSVKFSIPRVSFTDVYKASGFDDVLFNVHCIYKFLSLFTKVHIFTYLFKLLSIYIYIYIL